MSLHSIRERSVGLARRLSAALPELLILVQAARRILAQQAPLKRQRALVVRTHGDLETQLHQIVTAQGIADLSGRPVRHDLSALQLYERHPSYLKDVLPDARPIDGVALTPRGMDTRPGERPFRLGRWIIDRSAPIRIRRGDLGRIGEVLDRPVALCLEGEFDHSWRAFISPTRAREIVGALARDIEPANGELAVVLRREPYSDSRAMFDGQDFPCAASTAGLRSVLAKALEAGDADRVRVFSDDAAWVARQLRALPELAAREPEIVLCAPFGAAELKRVLEHGTIVTPPDTLGEWMDLLKHPGTLLRVAPPESVPQPR
jgi:hypothetical protein